jgi:hypothetical protein
MNYAELCREWAKDERKDAEFGQGSVRLAALLDAAAGLYEECCGETNSKPVRRAMEACEFVAKEIAP